MKQTIRNNVFETNSSSYHTITIGNFTTKEIKLEGKVVINLNALSIDTDFVGSAIFSRPIDKLRFMLCLASQHCDPDNCCEFDFELWEKSYIKKAFIDALSTIGVSAEFTGNYIEGIYDTNDRVDLNDVFRYIDRTWEEGDFSNPKTAGLIRDALMDDSVQFKLNICSDENDDYADYCHYYSWIRFV